jgi:hypothetical protein
VVNPRDAGLWKHVVDERIAVECVLLVQAVSQLIERAAEQLCEVSALLPRQNPVRNKLLPGGFDPRCLRGGDRFRNWEIHFTQVAVVGVVVAAPGSARTQERCRSAVDGPKSKRSRNRPGAQLQRGAIDGLKLQTFDLLVRPPTRKQPTQNAGEMPKTRQDPEESKFETKSPATVKWKAGSD